MVKKIFIFSLFICCSFLLASSPMGKGYKHSYFGFSTYENGYYSLDLEYQIGYKSGYGIELGYYLYKINADGKIINNNSYSVIPYTSYWLFNFFSNSLNIITNIGPGCDIVDSKYETSADIFLKNDFILIYSFPIYRLINFNFFAKFQNRIYFFRNSYNFYWNRNNWQRIGSIGFGFDF